MSVDTEEFYSPQPETPPEQDNVIKFPGNFAGTVETIPHWSRDEMIKERAPRVGKLVTLSYKNADVFKGIPTTITTMDESIIFHLDR